MRRSFFWRLYLGFVALLVLAALVSGVSLERFARQELLAGARASLRSQAALLADIARPALDGAPDPDLEARIRELGSFNATRLTLLRGDGTVLADSEEEPGNMDNHLRRPEVAEARVRGEAFAERTSSTTRESYLYYARAIPSAPDGPDAPTADGGDVIGYVRTASRLDAVAERLADLRTHLGYALAAAALVGLVLAWQLARRIAAPIASIAELAETIAGGDYRRAGGFERDDEIGRLAQAVGTMTAQLEERLATITADRNKVLAILASMVEGVIAVDRDQRVVHMNAVAGRLLDVQADACAGRRIWEVTRIAPVCEILDLTLGDSLERVSECRIASDPSGKSAAAALELRASPLRDGSGGLSGAVVVLHDVTALRRLESLRRDFVANVSHELKTPLTAIRALVETILDDRGMETGTRERFLEKIRDQSARLATLVGDLLTLARIESNEASIERRPLDLRGVARECASRILPACQKKGLALETELQGEPVMLDSDEESLRQILDNLLDNATKYTPTGGRIRVRIARSPGEVTLEVEDNGIGIDPRDQERVFERFFRVDKARSRELGGTGLGLSIVKHLTLALGGRVSLDSAPGRGSRFRVHLPSLDAAAPEGA